MVGGTDADVQNQIRREKNDVEGVEGRKRGAGRGIEEKKSEVRKREGLPAAVSNPLVSQTLIRRALKKAEAA